MRHRAGRGRRRPGGSRSRACARPTPPRSMSIRCLALAEAVQEHRHRADVEAVRAEPQQVVQMRVSSSNITRMYWARLGTSTPSSFSIAMHVGVLVAHHRHVVEPVHVADRLVVGLAARRASRSRGAAGRCAGRARMISPSISSTRRSTPWAAGCCGPKFMVSACWISGMRQFRRGFRRSGARVVPDARAARCCAARCSPAGRPRGPCPGRSALRHAGDSGKSLRNGWPMKP